MILTCQLVSFGRNSITQCSSILQGQFALYLYADFRDRGKGITPSQAKSIFFLSDGAVAPVLSVVQTLFGRLDQLQAAILRDFAQRMQEVF